MTLTGTNSIILNPAGDSTFSGSIIATGTNSRLPNQQISTDTASVLTVGLADGRYLSSTVAGIVNLDANQTFTGTNIFSGELKVIGADGGVRITGGSYSGSITTGSTNEFIGGSRYRGGSINTSANSAGRGGNINTSNGGGDIDTSGYLNVQDGYLAEGQAPGGSILTYGNYESSGGNIITAGGQVNGSNGGDINTSGGMFHAPGGSIDTRGGNYAAGGSIKTSGDAYGNSGGSIDTSGGGASIDTRSAAAGQALVVNSSNVFVPTNIPSLNADQTFDGLNTFIGSVTGMGVDNQMPNQTITGTASVLTKGLADELYMPASTTSSPYLTTTVAANTYVTSAQVASSYIPAGYQSAATGSYSTALGYNTIAAGSGQLVIGQYNSPLVSDGDNSASWVSTDALFVIGNGTSDLRSNALVVSKNGDALIAGSATVGKRLKVTGKAAFADEVTIPQKGDLSMGSFTNSGLTRAQTVAEAYFNTLASSPVAKNLSDTEKENIISFLAGLDQIVGLDNVVECWTLRATQNAGTGAAVYGFLKKYEATLINNPTWSPSGIISNSHIHQARTVCKNPATGPHSIFAVVSAYTAPPSWTNVWLGNTPDSGYSSQSIGFSPVTGYNSVCAMRLSEGGWYVGIYGVAAPWAALSSYDGVNLKAGLNGVYEGVNYAYKTGDKTTIAQNNFNLLIRSDGNAVDSTVAFTAVFSIDIDSAKWNAIYTLYKSTIGQGLGLP